MCFVLTTTVCADYCRVVKMIGRLQFQGMVLQLVLLQATNAHHNKQIHFQFPIISLGTGTMSIHIYSSVQNKFWPKINHA